MDFKTDSVTVRREVRTATIAPEGVNALAVTAAMNAVDPDNKVSFTSHDAVRNDDGSVTVTLTTETVVVDPAPAPAAPSTGATLVPPLPNGLASTIGALSGTPSAGQTGV